MASKAEKKAQQAEDYTKWCAELLALPGVQDVGGTATCAACGLGGHGKRAFPMTCSAGDWLTAQQAWHSHQRLCWGARPQEQQPPTKAEKKAQQAKDYAKWRAELLALPGVQDVGGTATCAACGLGGHGKRAFPMTCSAGDWLTAQQAWHSHQRLCWGARPQEEQPPTKAEKKAHQAEDYAEPPCTSPLNRILFVPAEGANSANADSKDVAIHGDDEGSAPDWREKAAFLLMQGVEKQRRKRSMDEVVDGVRVLQLGKRDQADKERLEHWRKNQLADRYGQCPRYHNGLGSEYERWLRPAVSPVRPRDRSREDRRRDRSREDRRRRDELRRYDEPCEDRRRREELRDDRPRHRRR